MSREDVVRRFLFASATVLAVGSGAGTASQAADIGATRVAVAAEVVAPAGLWHGFYAGLHAGWGRGRTVYDPLIIGLDINHSYGGALLGGQFGWNYQVGQLVLGLEATLAYSTLSGGLPEPAAPMFRTNLNWLATMGPRLGFAVDRALVYAKGGFAMAGLRSGIADPIAGDFRGSFARAGWFLGAGVEYAFAPHWSVRVEYNYLNFGNGLVTFQYLPPIGVGIPGRIDAHTVTVGVNYRFGGGHQAQVAGGGVPVWTGFYAGLHAGYGSGRTAYDPAVALPIDHQFSGVLAGGQFGWNYQVNQFVLGAEATLAYAGLNGRSDFGFIPIRTRMQWLATMGPRLGVAVDRALVYGKGGFAVAGFHGGADLPPVAAPAPFVRSGWFLGAGVEYAFAPNWSAKAEYNYVHLGNGPAIIASTFGIAETIDARQHAHTVTLGVNYHFTTGSGPVVARY
jgi:outer membrane immunogenic protein